MGQPQFLEGGAGVGAAHGVVAGRGGVVQDRVSLGVEAHQNHQVTVAPAQRCAGQFAFLPAEADGQRHACARELLGGGQAGQARHEGPQAQFPGVRGVEGPVAGAVVRPVVHAFRRFRHGDVQAVIRQDHADAGGAAPHLAAVRVDHLRTLRHHVRFSPGFFIAGLIQGGGAFAAVTGVEGHQAHLRALAAQGHAVLEGRGLRVQAQGVRVHLPGAVLLTVGAAAACCGTPPPERVPAAPPGGRLHAHLHAHAAALAGHAVPRGNQFIERRNGDGLTGGRSRPVGRREAPVVLNNLKAAQFRTLKLGGPFVNGGGAVRISQGQCSGMARAGQRGKKGNREKTHFPDYAEWEVGSGEWSVEHVSHTTPKNRWRIQSLFPNRVRRRKYGSGRRGLVKLLSRAHSGAVPGWAE